MTTVICTKRIDGFTKGVTYEANPVGLSTKCAIVNDGGMAVVVTPEVAECFAVGTAGDFSQTQLRNAAQNGGL